MESCSSLRGFCVTVKPGLLKSVGVSFGTHSSWRRKRAFFQVSAISFQKFIQFALNETKRQTHLVPSPLQVKFNTVNSMDGKTELQMLSFQASKIRLLRSLSIETEAMQVLDFAAFPEPEFDVPIFCANFFATTNTNIMVLDLNPLHDVISRADYKERYYKSLMSLGLKYSELLPWGGKLTGESLKFFSPIVIWTRFTPSQDKYEVLYSAFMDYYEAWLGLINRAVAETDASQIMCNREAQHRYLTWRAEKDPGHGVLKKFIGETMAKDVLRNFLFNGIDELGSRTFLDYFPEYRREDGTINEKRSVMGKSFENRPWDTKGNFIGDHSK
ncbi:phytochromobilin:ferredoxin oxidoreductase, chloroplastic [Juglans microcarpa x Juglans regia]|uniref:phytochromobilin:ferredoxin oxidoreductase, chloroplastic n=1 Tax=Juglans microcarpa x Juglans regia TaxID=2249226 RepID=UPI001B7EF8B3|nr:phytochromobilin:ferredoxin oxidoreductase, chloroplastic [Juglans microcarpa x Juglans regia]